MKVSQVGKDAFDVHSDSGKDYFVAMVHSWVCDCPDFLFKSTIEKPRECKHILEVKKCLKM